MWILPVPSICFPDGKHQAFHHGRAGEAVPAPRSRPLPASLRRPRWDRAAAPALTALHGGPEGGHAVMESISHVHQHEGHAPGLEHPGGRRPSEAAPDHHDPHGGVQGQAGAHGQQGNSGSGGAPAGPARPGARRHCPPGRSCGRSRAPPGRSARRPDLAEPGTQSLQSPALPGRAPAGREWLLPRRAPRPERRALHLSCREKGSEGFTNRALLLTSQVGRLGG